MKLSPPLRFFFFFTLFAGIVILPLTSDEITDLTVEWIDSSGSMEGSMEEVLLAAGNLIDQFDRGDRAEILDFDSKIVPRQAFTQSKDEMRNALSEITVGGGTALYDAVATGLDHLSKKVGMKAILVLSDGEDENSTAYDFPALRERLLSEGVRMFAIALGKNVDAGRMNEIAELTGGSFYRAEQTAEVGPIYSGIITYLHRLHRFWYSTSLGMFDGTEREVEFEQKSSGISDSAFYQAPRADTWAHAIDYNFEHSPAPVKIGPD